MRLLDPRFKWQRHGDVQAVWRKHGWRPTTMSERRRQQLRTEGTVDYPPLSTAELETARPQPKLKRVK